MGIEPGQQLKCKLLIQSGDALKRDINGAHAWRLTQRSRSGNTAEMNRSFALRPRQTHESPLESAERRAQLTALNDDIQSRSTVPLMNGTVQNASSGTSNNSNNVGTLGQSADSLYSQMQMQAVMDKLDELINALRR